MALPEGGLWNRKRGRGLRSFQDSGGIKERDDEGVVKLDKRRNVEKSTDDILKFSTGDLALDKGLKRRKVDRRLLRSQRMDDLLLDGRGRRQRHCGQSWKFTQQIPRMLTKSYPSRGNHSQVHYISFIHLRMLCYNMSSSTTPITTTRPRTTKPRGICKYYTTPRGCFAGSSCKFLHGTPEQLDPQNPLLTPHDESKRCIFYAQG